MLAERLGVTDRTVRRDVERLREMGYRIVTAKGPDGGYRLDAGADLPPLLFDDDQVIALTVALQAATVAGAGTEEAALRALTTVRQVLPSRLRHRLDAVRFTAIAGPSVAIPPGFPDVLIALSRAVDARHVLRFAYSPRTLDSEAAPSPPRRVEPHDLVTVNGLWYLVAWDLERDEWRIFRADGIDPHMPTGPRFTPREFPGGDVREFVLARFKGAERLNGWPCTGTVILHLPASAVLPFAGDGTVEGLGADRCRYRAGSWSWTALAASLGRFDTDIDVVDPPELAEAFGRLAARYASTASSTA